MTIYIAGDNIISSLGFTTDENMDNVLKEITGIRETDDRQLSPEGFPLALVYSQKLSGFFKDIANTLVLNR